MLRKDCCGLMLPIRARRWSCYWNYRQGHLGSRTRMGAETVPSDLSAIQHYPSGPSLNASGVMSASSPMDICRYIGHGMQELWNQGRASPCRAMVKDCHAKLVSRRRFNVWMAQECMAFLIMASLGLGVEQVCVGLEARGLGDGDSLATNSH